jgi:hypothetical protein
MVMTVPPALALTAAVAMAPFMSPPGASLPPPPQAASVNVTAINKGEESFTILPKGINRLNCKTQCRTEINFLSYRTAKIKLSVFLSAMKKGVPRILAELIRVKTKMIFYKCHAATTKKAAEAALVFIT